MVRTGGAGIWQGGVGPAVDASGNIYLITGNGDLTAPSSGQSYGQSVVRMNGLNLAPTDYFSPSDFTGMTNPLDLDLGPAEAC